MLYLAVILITLIINCVIADNEKFRACTVGRADCSELQPSVEAVKFLKNTYGQCKYIFGNLVICDLNRLENGSDPDLSFLEKIEEVSGYVFISRNAVKNIPLKSLRIIRGESSYRFGENNGSLIVTRNYINNYALETIDFRNLIAIQHQNVIVKDNPRLCNFAFTVYWNEVFTEPKVQRYIPDRTNSSISQRDCNINFGGNRTQTYKSCAGTCTMVNSKGYCWGPDPELCQKMVKCHNNPNQYCVDGPVSNEICSEECLGGCENTPSNCRACRHVRNNGKCIAQCPPQFIFSGVDRRTVLNPDFKYSYYYECVDDCPAPFLKSKSYCVIECDLNTETAINGTCVPCQPPACPQHCTQQFVFDSAKQFILDADALHRLKDCSHYTGLLYLSAESFKKSSLIKTPINDLSLLWNLRNLQSIVGRVYFDFRGAPPSITNLTFLRNLRSLVYEARDAYSTRVLQIMNGENIEMLGLRSLKSVHGVVYFENMTKLCYLDALEKLTQIRKINVPTKDQCASRGAVCHSECLPHVGCWGPGANMCGHCCNLQAGDVCVSECTDQAGFYEVPSPTLSPNRHLRTDANYPFCLTLPLNESQINDVDDAYLRFSKHPAKQCERCHPECAETCYGPESNQCKGRCKHFQDGDRCVAVCPVHTYPDQSTMRCLPCSNFCKPNYPADVPLCSGPGSFFGLGGCTACWTVIQNASNKTFDCLNDDCPVKHYEESYKTVDFVKRENISITKDTEDLGRNLINVCRPCHPYCSVCTANGTHKPICHSCIHWWFRDECVKECPPTETYTLPVENSLRTVTTATYSTTAAIFPLPSTSLELARYARAASSDNLTVPSALHSSVPLANPRPSFHFSEPEQRYCLLCHEECVQGCSGPGPEDCVKCRNFKIIMDTDESKFVCQPSCPDHKSYVLHSMCLTEEQYAKLSGRDARELRDRILIGVAVAIIVLIIMTTVLLILCLKRRAETERTRAKLFSAYTNLDVSDKESLIKNQSTIREPNMGRLEMISINDLDYDSSATPLGTGAFGVVYRGVWRLSKSALLKHGCHGAHKFDVAIKVIQNDFPITPAVANPNSPTINGVLRDPEEDAWRAAARTNIEELLQEAKVMASVEHQHCLPLIGVCLTRECHCLVTMFLELGSLDRFVKEHQDDLNSLTLLTWAEQIADGMSYLEMRGIIHRDLAARNVLVQRQDLVQITDFGLAKMLERRDEDSVVVRAGRVPIRWLAIETLQDSVYSHKTDVWAYGVTLWEIFTYGRRPYEDVDTKDIKDHVMKGGRLTQPDICTLDVYMVMVKCWMEDYESRPTFTELTKTFSSFCKTPGRYLYIQGDEYAIHYPTINTFGSSNSADTHELRPLISPRGVPDGSVSGRINGSLPRQARGTTASIGSYPSQLTTRSPKSEYISPVDDEHEPSDADALLPVRNAGHSLWPLRPRGQGVGASDSTRSSGIVPTAGGIRSVNKAPLVSREDSWLTDAPSSPSWRIPKSSTTAGHDNFAPASSAGSITPLPLSHFSNPDSHEKSLPSQTTTQRTQQSGISDLPWPPQKPPTELPDGYLEPKSTLVSPQKPSKLGKASMNLGGEDYLVPKKGSGPPDQSSGSAFGITNMEYFMQPYISASETYPPPPHTGSDVTNGSDEKQPI